MDLFDEFLRGRELLLRAADEVPAELRMTPFVGHWHLMDVLAHLVGWDYTNVQAIDELLAGTTPAFYGHYDPGWASYNQQLIERYGAEDWQALREALTRSLDSVTTKLLGLSDEDLTREISALGRRRPITIAGILRAAIKDELEHLQQIQAFLASGRWS